jgi:SOS response regulatory protein OraA/RecX
VSVELDSTGYRGSANSAGYRGSANSAGYRGSANSTGYRGRAGGEAVKVHLSDGSFYVLHAEVWARAGLSTGSPLDPDSLSALLTRSEMIFARRRALALLSRAAQTRLGLARKLAARGFSQPAIRHAINRMTSLGYLDDRAFAQAWVQARLASRKEGWLSLYRGLVGRGIPRALADEVAAELYSPELEAACALRLAAGLSPQAAIRRLNVRGFRSRAIAAAVRALREKAAPPEEG